MSVELLRRCDFDWVTRLDDVWKAWPEAEHFVHAEALGEMLAEIDAMQADRQSPLGRVMVGSAGAGKTHLLRHLRREVQQTRMGFFFLIDCTDVLEFWSTLRLGLMNGLVRESHPGWTQAGLLRYWLTRSLFDSDEACSRAITTEAEPASIRHRLNEARRLPGFPYEPGVACGPVLLALFYLAGPDPVLRDQAMAWLQGIELDQTDAQILGLPTKPCEALMLLRVVTAACASFGPIVIAFDQLDALISQKQLHDRQPGEAQTEAHAKAEAILKALGAGLMSIPDHTRRTLTVLSCLRDNWTVLARHIGPAAQARFREELIELRNLPDPARVRRVIRARVDQAAAELQTETGSQPVLELFEGAFADMCAALTPREILQKAERHRLDCLKKERLLVFGQAVAPSPPPPVVEGDRLSTSFSAACHSVDIEAMVGEAGEDGLGRSLVPALSLLRFELSLPGEIDFTVDSSFAGGRSYPTLHARLRLVFRNEGDREFHVCLRVLEKIQPTAFIARLNAAMIESGIDRDLPYRRLFILRHGPLAFTGPKSRQIIRLFEERKGQFISMPEATMRTIAVLLAWKKAPPTGFEEWLATRKPLSTSVGIDRLVEALREALPKEATQPVTAPHEKTGEPVPVGPETPAHRVQRLQPGPETTVILGYRDGAPAFADPVRLPVTQLSQHVVIRAGSGGGKTVLVKRLLEQAGLAGISSVVLDPGNDLAQMALDWDQTPAGWLPGDEDQWKQFRSAVDVVIYTPGRSDGRPLHLPYLPDFAALRNDPDDLQAAVEAAVERLASRIASGKSAQAQHKRGILAQAFRTMAERKRPASLTSLTELLETDPESIDIGLPKAGSLIESLAGSIRAMLAQSPALDRTDCLVDWAELFGLRSGRTRISVINFAGLPGLDRQQDFVAGLAESLFAWMRLHPSSGQGGLTGLLALDEAKDFLPGQSSPVCKKPLMRLAAQARKYGMGLVVATQNPKDLDYNAVAQFSTQYFGRANAPQVIDFVQKLLTEKGATSARVASLQRGPFYLTAGSALAKPHKVSVPLCLTAHPDGKPLTLDQVVALAQKR